MTKVKRYGVRWMEYFLTSEPDIVEVADGEFAPFKDYDELRERVQWMLETMGTKHSIVSYTSDKAVARGLNGAESLGNIRENARKAVEELL